MRTNEQMKPQQMKQKSQLPHQSQVVKRHSSKTFERLSCAVFSLRGSPPPPLTSEFAYHEGIFHAGICIVFVEPESARN